MSVGSINYLEQNEKITTNDFPKYQLNRKKFGTFCINSYPFQCKIA